jgi:hypothetical protein
LFLFSFFLLAVNSVETDNRLDNRMVLLQAEGYPHATSRYECSTLTVRRFTGDPQTRRCAGGLNASLRHSPVRTAIRTVPAPAACGVFPRR